MPVHKMKFVVANNMAPRRPSVCTAPAICLHGVFAAAATGLLARSFQRQALLRDPVLPPMDGGELCRIDRSSESVRTRRRLAETDR